MESVQPLSETVHRTKKVIFNQNVISASHYDVGSLEMVNYISWFFVGNPAQVFPNQTGSNIDCIPVSIIFEYLGCFGQ